MEASLDTNVIIHLYGTNFQNILFRRFNQIKVYEFIRYHEMENHATSEVKDMFDKDVKARKIELVNDAYLKGIGMYDIFLQHVKEISILFDGSDLGEVYGIAIAKTLGCICLVTNDIKERGPHYTLMRIPDSDVMPLAFYEILFLDYLEEKILEEEMLRCFNTIRDFAGMKFECSSKLKSFIRRFWAAPYSENEKEWMKSFCSENNIDAKQRMKKLSTYLSIKSKSFAS